MRTSYLSQVTHISSVTLYDVFMLKIEITVNCSIHLVMGPKLINKYFKPLIENLQAKHLRASFSGTRLQSVFMPCIMWIFVVATSLRFTDEGREEKMKMNPSNKLRILLPWFWTASIQWLLPAHAWSFNWCLVFYPGLFTGIYSCWIASTLLRFCHYPVRGTMEQTGKRASQTKQAIHYILEGEVVIFKSEVTAAKIVCCLS